MGNSEEAKAGWVRLAASRLWRWEGGPVVISLKAGAGWMLELSRHGLNGRISIPIDGPFESFREARDNAERRLPACRGAGIKGDPLRHLRLLREQAEIDRLAAA